MIESVIFSHGRESGPWGTKITRLARVAEEEGIGVESIDYRGVTDPLERVKMLLDHCRGKRGGYVLAGSSMGGAVTLAAACQLAPSGIFLMAPAIGIPGYPDIPPPTRETTTLIVHGWDDDVVPPGPVIEYARGHRMELVMLPDGHALEKSLDHLARLFRVFVMRVRW